jgi:hypothetical protein
MALFGNTLGKLRHSWNAFLNTTPSDHIRSFDYGVSYGGRPDRSRLSISNERSIISSIYTRLGIDIATTEIHHVRLDQDDRYKEEMDSGLNECLNVEANIDQAASAFRQDIAMSLFDEGIACIVPVDTTMDPSESTNFEIKTLRVGRIVQWMPDKVRINLYNDRTGRREEITLPKQFVGIVENPLYAVMNEPNSTLQRLIRKINILDAIDEQSGSGKLDIIIQLPYVVKTESKKQQAEQRRKDIEFQLKGSKYGIAYTDGTEKITQLNRPTENNLLGQIEYLVKMLYSQLGLTEGVMDGTADEKTMLNYNNRTIEPIVRAIVEEMKRKFLTKTARSQKQSIIYFRDPFRLIPIADIAEIADKLSRNEIASANEIRSKIGLKPSTEPKADKLVNSNLKIADTGVATGDVIKEPVPVGAGSIDVNEGNSQNGSS